MSVILPQGGSDAFALLSVISDPKAAKQRLEELSKIQEDLKRITDEQREFSRKIESERISNEKTLSKISEENLIRKDKITNREKELSDLKISLDSMFEEQKRKRDDLEVYIKDKKNELAQRESSLNIIQRNLESQKNYIQETQQKIDLMKKEWDDKIAKLKGAMS